MPLRELVQEGKVSMKTINSRVADVLRVKFRLGLFDHPYADAKLADKGVHTAADEAFALQLNRESLVLLKNDQQTLPLDKQKIRHILVTGPLAAATTHAVSRYGPSNNKVTSVLEGITQYAGKNINVQYAKGCDVVNPGWPGTELIPTPLDTTEKAAIAEAVSKAAEADVIIAVVGEDEKRVGESLSRTDLSLPGRQLQLLQALHATGKPVVAVLINGQPLTINWEQQNLPAILEAWFPGPQGGTAIAETLFGDYNPGGRLTVTFPKTTGQIELNFPFKPGSHAGQPASGNNGFGKTSVNGALFPFGYGLSYTSFAYSNLVVTPAKQASQGDIHISVDITNTGKRKGDEVVQVYLKDKVSSVTTYVMQLRGFERVGLEPGEKKTLSFVLHPDDLAILDRNMNWTVEAGEFEILVGASSEDIKLKQGFVIE